jgi:hypothetical protein
MKRYVEFEFDFGNDPDSANLNLWLPDGVLSRIDAALSRKLPTREDFAVCAILWALQCVDAAAVETMIAFDA